MKTKFSVLISDLSGSSGDVVASKTHGIPYVRRRVIPKYTNTDTQAGIRKALSRCPGLFRGLPANLVVLVNDAVAGTILSGYNALTKAWLKCLAFTIDHVLTPKPLNLLESVGSIANAAIVGGTGSGEDNITVTWNVGAALDTHYVVAYAAPTQVALDTGLVPDGIIFATPVLVTAGTADIEDLVAGKTYDVGIFTIDAASLGAATLLSDSGTDSQPVTAGA